MRNTCLGAPQENGSRASSVTIQGDTVVPNIHKFTHKSKACNHLTEHSAPIKYCIFYQWNLRMGYNTFRCLPKLFPRKGPRGTYSHAWISLAVKNNFLSIQLTVEYEG